MCWCGQYVYFLQMEGSGCVRFLISSLMYLSLSGCMGVTIIDAGYRGVFKNFGKVSETPLSEGIHFYNPFSSDIEEMNIQEVKWEDETSTYTRDTQKTKIAYTLNFYPDEKKMPYFYTQYGTDWAKKLIPQMALGTIKDVFGKINADEINGAREKTAQEISSHLHTKLLEIGIYFRAFEITHLTFEAAYEAAVEAKVIATQHAIESKNKTAMIEEQAKQTVVSARAEAQSMMIRSEALSKNKGLIGYEAIQKWDGKLPRIILGDKSMPILQMGEFLK